MLFTHVDRFREYVAAGLLPLSRFFPDYDAENEDVAAAQDFITEKVTGPVSRIKPVRSFFVNALDTNSVETAWRAIMKHSFATRVTPIGKR